MPTVLTNQTMTATERRALRNRVNRAIVHIWTGGPHRYPTRHLLHRMIRDEHPEQQRRIARLFTRETAKLELIFRAIRDHPDFSYRMTRVEVMGVILKFEIAFVHLHDSRILRSDADKENEKPQENQENEDTPTNDGFDGGD
ncbi:MAG: hypothetical protein MMC33_008149 [Icmadophila ericetorum]|nr:hypothetical protein [Icmadophila ericetorum]